MSTRRDVRVLLADDQRLVRESLGTLLELLGGIELVGTASDGQQALELTAEHRPQIVLMDLRMPRMDGIEATRRLRERHPDVQVIALTTFADDESVLAMLRAGARGYLTKDASSEDIQRAIVTVAAGEAALMAFEDGCWGQKYPAISQSWRRAWTEVVPFYAFPGDVRRILYTTNAIEALNSKLRRAVRARGHFPSDEAATKLLFLVLNRAEKEWIMPPREWSMAKAQFAVLFGERFTRAMA